MSLIRRNDKPAVIQLVMSELRRKYCPPVDPYEVRLVKEAINYIVDSGRSRTAVDFEISLKLDWYCQQILRIVANALQELFDLADDHERLVNLRRQLSPMPPATKCS